MMIDTVKSALRAFDRFWQPTVRIIQVRRGHALDDSWLVCVKQRFKTRYIRVDGQRLKTYWSTSDRRRAVSCAFTYGTQSREDAVKAARREYGEDVIFLEDGTVST